jgi:hypothetical protein
MTVWAAALKDPDPADILELIEELGLGCGKSSGRRLVTRFLGKRFRINEYSLHRRLPVADMTLDAADC